MTTVQLQQWVHHPETLNQESLYELRTLVARYPYFQTARLLYLKNLFLLHDISFGAELRKSVLYIADRRLLFYFIEGERYTLRRDEQSLPILEEMEEEPGVDRTLFLIDAFLSTMPYEQSQPSDLDYSMDYTAYLLQKDSDSVSVVSDSGTEAVQPLRGQALIDGFLNKMSGEEGDEKKELGMDVLPNSISGFADVESNEAGDEEPISPTEGVDDSCFTETLAKIYIKQHRYEKALEIIKKLSLNYPKKNAYFADQIRFLEKLIINAKSK